MTLASMYCFDIEKEKGPETILTVCFFREGGDIVERFAVGELGEFFRARNIDGSVPVTTAEVAEDESADVVKSDIDLMSGR